MSDERDEERTERQRPRVVDKRVSSGGGESSPAPEASAPAQEPAAPRQDPSPQQPPEAPATSAAAPGGEQEWTPEQEAQARQIAEEIVRTPSSEWVVNVAVNLVNVAAAKLDLGDPQDARLAIDCLSAILDGVGDRLGDVEAPLRQTLAQLQMGFTAKASAPPSS